MGLPQLPLALRDSDLGAPLVVGVSGGVDSVVLLDRLLRRKPRGPIHVAHVNYRLRPGADADAASVAELAAHYAVPLHTKVCRHGPAGRNLQDWARELRYRYFANIARRVAAPSVLVAHHADDQAETMLWHLLRGTGLSGLGGMSPRRPLAPGIELVRPLLAVTRAQITHYATARRLRYGQDPSNRDPRFTRSRIRGELLPLCEAIQPGAAAHVAGLAARIQDAAQCLAILAQTAFATLVQAATAQQVRWERKAFWALPSALRVHILRHAYAQVVPRGHQLTAHHLRTMEQIAGGQGMAYALPGRFYFARRGNSCILTRGPLPSKDT